MVDFGAAAATPGGIPAPLGQLAAAVLAGDGPAAIRLARQTGALPPDVEVDPRLIIERCTRSSPRRPAIASLTRAGGCAGSWPTSPSRASPPRFAPALRNLTPPPEYALVWRATLSAAGLFAQRGATVVDEQIARHAEQPWPDRPVIGGQPCPGMWERSA
jgi:hypothetical protein